MKIKCRDTGETVYTYSDYLKTRHWQYVRELAFANSNGLCPSCKKPLSNNFIGHHRSYARIGHERMNHRFFRDDVIAVCPQCHNGDSKAHDRLHELVRVPYYAKTKN